MTAPPLRPMEAADLPTVLRLERAIFSEPWTEGMFRDEVAGPGRTYLVAGTGSQIVGYGGVMVVEGDAHIMTMAVAPGHRRTGIATRLLLALVDEALRLGAHHLTLELRVSNAAARSLYEKFGFARVGLRPRYYQDEDALVMWALDASGDEYRARLDAIREAVG